MPWPPMQILPAAKPLKNKDLASCNTSGSKMVKTLLTYFRYSFILSSCYGFLLTFGFIMMTPQLFINYKWVFSIFQSYLKLARDFFGGRFSLGQHRVSTSEIKPSSKGALRHLGKPVVFLEMKRGAYLEQEHQKRTLFFINSTRLYMIYQSQYVLVLNSKLF